MIRRTLILAALPLALVAAAAPQSQDVRTATVSTAGLDLTSRAGAAELDRRIARAIETICRAEGVRGVAAVSREAHCRDTARASAAPQVAEALASARTGRRLAANDVTVRAK